MKEIRIPNREQKHLPDSRNQNRINIIDFLEIQRPVLLQKEQVGSIFPEEFIDIDIREKKHSSFFGTQTVFGRDYLVGLD